MKKTAKRLLLLAGPTASGKTEIAEELCSILGGEMISCDSMQVYRDMPILVQAPENARLAKFVAPSRSYSAARFREDATAALGEIWKKGKLPVLVGGTGLYFRALLDGLFESEGKATDEKIRRRLKAEAKKSGAAALHERLVSLDPECAKKIHPNDLRRLVRALEVCELTGGQMSRIQRTRKGLRSKVPHRFFALDRDRKDLYARCEKRVDRMLEDGLMAEVKALSKKRLSRTARMALGFREMTAAIEGETPLPQAIELLKRNTRRYAKRQLSWFRHEKGVEWIPVADNESAKTVAKRIVTLWKEGPWVDEAFLREVAGLPSKNLSEAKAGPPRRSRALKATVR